MIEGSSKWRYKTPVLACNEQGEVMSTYPNRYEASFCLARLQGRKSNTVDKEIRKSIRKGIMRYGYLWKYKEQ